MKVYLVSKTNTKDRKELSQIDALKMDLEKKIPAEYEIQLLAETGSDLFKFKSELSELQIIDLEHKRAKIKRNSEGEYYFYYLSQEEIHISTNGLSEESKREQLKRERLKNAILDNHSSAIVEYMMFQHSGEYSKEELLETLNRITFVIK